MAADSLNPAAMALSGLIGPTSAQAVHCVHCNERVPPGLVDHSPNARQFCCNGCRMANEMISACGLDKYYELLKRNEQAEGRSARSVVARSSAGRYAEFDDEAFARLYVRDAGGGLQTAELYVESVHCSACLWLLEKLPRVAPGVAESRLDMHRKVVRITWDPKIIRLSRVARTLDSLGYPPHPVRHAADGHIRRLEDRRRLVRLGIAGACAGNIMLLAFALYAGLFDGIDRSSEQLFRWLSLAITTVSLAWPGREFFRGAWASIRTRTLQLDLPIALGLGAGYLWSVIRTIDGALGQTVHAGSDIYFDSLGMLVFALLAGRYVQQRQQRWAADSVELLFSLTPTSARLVSSDAQGREIIADVSIETLTPGHIVEIRPGECLPGDGVVHSGESELDQSILTGESLPVAVRPGASVCAGAINRTGTLRVRVQSVGADTRIGKLMRVVEGCLHRRAPIVQLADRMAGWFLVAMLLLAAGTIIGWWHISPSKAIEHGVALLIVSCPCGLGLATPLAMTVALGRAARAGILIKGADALQSLAPTRHAGHRGTIVLDKTGTLTQGRLSVAYFEGPEDLKPLVAEVESHSTHPIAAALVRDLGGAEAVALSEHRQADSAGKDARARIGGGVHGSVAGTEVHVGSIRFMTDSGVPVPDAIAARCQVLASKGFTPVLARAHDGKSAEGGGEAPAWAVIALGDELHADAEASLRRLSREGWRIQILSGDHPALVAAVAERLGVPAADARGGASPEEKLARIEQLRATETGPIIMVGDGVNDAAALAAATVGVAVRGLGQATSEASLAAAMVHTTRPGLTPIVHLLSGSRRTMLVVKRNLGVSIAYNVLACALAIAGVATPLAAAIIMPVSSLTVLALSFDVWNRRSRQRTSRSVEYSATTPGAKGALACR